ncbi:MAG: sterol desaturase family protein [Burkholderiales bacterium]|nr:sterol desaturase family protein [Burkholderiales bacterium]
MSLFNLENSKSGYRVDFVLYGAASVLMAVVLIIAGPRDRGWEIVTLVLTGLVAWTFLEYALHRFVLHGLKPFRTWHVEHHRHPAALICTPTILIGALIAALVLLPALVLADLWRAYALSFGLLAGCLVYAITHHALHHWNMHGAWFMRRKRWHALHHDSRNSPLGRPGYYGVTSSFWDHVLGSHDQ